MVKVTRKEVPNLSDREWAWIEDSLKRLPKNTSYEVKSLIGSLIMNLDDAYKRGEWFRRLFHMVTKMSGLDSSEVQQQVILEEYGNEDD